jgi:hypothetical protein
MAENDVHPIVERCAQMIVRSGEAPPFVLDDPGAKLIEDELRALFGTEELRTAVADLIRLACHLDTERSSPEAAQRILAVLECCVDPLRALDTAEPDPESEDAAKKLIGTEPPKAPKVGESAPRGSVKLGSLDYPKRG